MSGRPSPLPAWLLLALLVIGPGAPGGCASSSDPVNHPEHRLAGTDTQQAQRQFDQLLEASAQGRLGSVLDIAGSLLDHHPDFARNDEVYALAVQAALAKPDPALASKLASEFQARYPDSALLPAAAAAPAQIGEHLGHGEPADSAGLAENAGPIAPVAPQIPVDPDLIGILAPLTGPDAGLGNAFVEGALLAVQRAGAALGRPFRLQTADTGSDPVQSALAARSLCLPHGCLAVVGAMGSATTVAAALVADRYGVPLLSSTAAHERIGELGPGIFQVGLTNAQEIESLVELGMRVLLKNRYAVLAPDTPEGRRQAGLFRDRVHALGGLVVAAEFFRTDAVDFQQQILQIRRERAEVVFVPASVDQAALICPQLEYHQCGSLVMGLSNWNDARLLALAGGSLERTLFPDGKALFPAEWTRDFERTWDPQAYSDEAADLALWSYQATRMLLEAAAAAGARDRQALCRALTERLAGGFGRSADLQTVGAGINVVADGMIGPFPGELFRDSGRDSTGTDPGR